MINCLNVSWGWKNQPKQEKQKKQRFDFSEEKWPLEWEFIDLICF